MSRSFQLTAWNRYLTKPIFLAQHMDDRETIAHTEAVDRYMAHMFAYPGRTFGQLYHAFFRVNGLVAGKLELQRRPHRSTSRDVRQPVLTIAGSADVLAPGGRGARRRRPAAERRRGAARDVPGGHLGVLTGRSAQATTWEHLDEFLAAARAAARVHAAESTRRRR